MPTHYTTWLLGCGILLSGSWVKAQSTTLASINLDLETQDKARHLPAGWAPGIHSPGAPTPGYQVQTDSVVHQQGRYSVRLQSSYDAGTNSFGAAHWAIPARYQGKSITLSGYLKTEAVQNGFAGLWMRLDGPNGTLGFDNMQKANLQGTHGWQLYSITLPLAPEAKTIYLGGLLVGTGSAWLDNLSLTIDGKPLTQARPKAATVYKADADTAFQKSSGIAFSKLSAQQVENLAVLGQVWGFVKYYHPAVARGEYNWDKELFRIMPAVLASQNQADRSRVLSTWLTGLGPVTSPVAATVSPSKIRVQPTLAWLTDGKQLSKELQQQLLYLRAHPAAATAHYYVGPAEAGNLAFLHEDAYAQMAYPDAGYRLLGLFRYWNIIEYFFPYKYAIGEDWQPVLSEFIPQFANAPDALHYRLAALRLIARVHDTHANLWGADKVLTDYRGNYTVPVSIQFVQQQAVVAKLRPTTQAAPTVLQPGDIITTVDGEIVADWVKARQPIFPASNQPTQLRNMAGMLLRGNTPTVRLGIIRNGKASTLDVNRVSLSSLTPPTQTAATDSSHRFLRPDVGYLTLGQISTKSLPRIMSEFSQTKGLVIDIRNYPAEFVVFTLSQYLVPRPTPFVKFSIPVPSQPGLFTWTNALHVRPGKGQAYPGKVVILVNEETQSQAEYTTMALRTAPRATVLGSTTAGADGNVSRFALPGNLSTMISGIGIYYPDGRETQRVGIVPDVEMHPTVQGLQAGRDELLEKALELIDQG